MTPEHRRKLSQRYWERKRAKEQGIRLPTRKEEREAKRLSIEPINEESVNELVSTTPATVEDTRINNPEYYPTESAINKRHPIRFRETHEQVKKQEAK